MTRWTPTAHNAPAAERTIRCVSLAASHKREDQAKGKCIMPRGRDIRLIFCSYIKELAERVGALECDRVQIAQSPNAHFPALSPVSQSHGLPMSYSGTPPRYGSNKRTHSMSEDLQNSPALQAQLQASVNLPTKPGPGPAVQRSITTEGDRASYPVEEMETALNV